MSGSTKTILLGLTLAVPPVLVAVILPFTIASDSFEWAANWGDAFSVGGVLLSWIGFALTIVTAMKSRSAAERAEEAAESTKNSVRYFDAIMQLTRAIEMINSITACHREGAWASLPNRYSHLRESLLAIGALGVKLNADHKATISGVLLQLKDIDKEVERAIQNNSVPRKNLGTIEILKEQTSHLNEILFQIRDSHTEEPANGK